MRSFAFLSLIAASVVFGVGQEPVPTASPPPGEPAEPGLASVQASTVVYYVPDQQRLNLETRVAENGVLYLRDNGTWRPASFEESRAIYAADPSLLTRDKEKKASPPKSSPPVKKTAAPRPAAAEMDSGYAKNPVEAAEESSHWLHKIFAKPLPPEPRFKGPGIIIKARLKKQEASRESGGEPNLIEKLLAHSRRNEVVPGEK